MKLKDFIKKGVIFIMACTLTFSVLGGCDNRINNGGIKKNRDVNAYDILGIGEIPVGMWVTFPASIRNDAQFKKMKECGINFINGFEYNEPTEEEIRSALTLAGANGLKYFVNDRRISLLLTKHILSPKNEYVRQAMEIMENYYDYPAYAGQLLIDEPSRAQFSAIKDFVDAYRENYPRFQWHINMFPSYAEVGTGVPYEQYVDDWLSMVEPNYYSYDSYPLLEYDPDDYFAKPEDHTYYYNLDILRAKTLALNIPLWSFIQTLGFINPAGIEHRTPSREDIRWQVFTNLAFGVKGIQYFCYCTPESGREIFYDALIDKNGNPTVRYEYVKELNNEFKEYGKILLRCDAEGVMISGVNLNEKRYRLYSEPLNEYGNVVSKEGKFLAGCLKDLSSGKKRMMFTPLTPRDSATVNLTLKGGNVSVNIYNSQGVTTKKITDGQLNFEIDAGDAVFVEFL